jgi:ubiquitin-activating enzyme E1 C
LRAGAPFSRSRSRSRSHTAAPSTAFNRKLSPRSSIHNRYSGPDGVYTHTFAHERDPSCPVCSPGVSIEAPLQSTLREVIAAIKSHPTIGPLVSHPSVSHGSDNLYVRGALEELTRGNLDKGMRELLLAKGGGGGGGEEGGGGGGRVSATLTVNDKQLAAPLRVRLTLL